MYIDNYTFSTAGMNKLKILTTQFFSSFGIQLIRRLVNNQQRWTEQHNDNLHDVCLSLNVIRGIKWCRSTRAGHVALWRIRESVQSLVGKREGRRPLGRPRCRCEDIKMDLNVVGINIVHWISVTCIWYKWQPLGNLVMGCRVV